MSIFTIFLNFILYLFQFFESKFLAIVTNASPLLDLPTFEVVGLSLILVFLEVFIFVFIDTESF